MFGTLLPILGVAVLLLLGLWLRWPTVVYDRPQTQDAYNYFAFERFAYSDIASLYFRDGLAGNPIPYLDYPLEYPVGTGVGIYLLRSVTSTMPQYFLLTSLALAASVFWVAALVPRFPRGSLPLFALSPALALYTNLNWDMWGVLLAVAALLLFVRERDDLSAVVLAAATWTKFFPVLFLPFLLMDLLGRRGRWGAMRFAAVFAMASVAINGPVLLLSPEGWWYFFRFNTDRPGELNNLWGFFDPSWLSVEEINRVNALLLLWGLVVLLMLQRRAPQGLCPAWLPACAAMLAWFFFTNKVYSPQYSLWVVAMLAVVGAAPALAVAWSGVDLLYFGAQFALLGLFRYQGAQDWFADYAFVPAVALREMMLLVVICWCLWRMRVPSQEEPARLPRSSPAAE